MSDNLLTVNDFIPLIISQLGLESLDTILPILQHFVEIDQGRHWRHTLKVVSCMNILLTGPQHPQWRQVFNSLLNEPALIDWLTRSKQDFTPDLLQVIALLHDLGKGVSLAKHAEYSFLLFKQAVERRNIVPSSEQELIALVIRHHTVFSSLRMGECSEVGLLPLIEDILHYHQDTNKFLTVLILLTIADWAAYHLLTAPTMYSFLSYANFLQHSLWETHSVDNIKQCLWCRAIQQTSERLNNLILHVFLPQLSTDVRYITALNKLAEITIMQSGMHWQEFQSKFALVTLEGGYSVFAQYLVLTTNIEDYLTFLIQQLSQWLPTSNQVKVFEDSSVSFLVNLRPVIEKLHIKDLQMFQDEIIGHNLTEWTKKNIQSTAYG